MDYGAEFGVAPSAAAPPQPPQSMRLTDDEEGESATIDLQPFVRSPHIFPPFESACRPRPPSTTTGVSSKGSHSQPAFLPSSDRVSLSFPYVLSL